VHAFHARFFLQKWRTYIIIPRGGMQMKAPKMIMFDYGNTLLSEPDIDFVRAQREVFKYIRKNKYNMTPEEVNEFMQIKRGEKGAVRTIGFEIHEYQFFRFVYEYLGIEFDLPMEEFEIIYWDAVSPGGVMPGADKMLGYIKTKGIRSAVISNIGWSGKLLSDRINRLLPDNEFEFIMASSEYVFGKPNRNIFDLALRKADLDASEVWYCGDNVKVDIDGAAGAGIQPIWYENTEIINPWRMDKSIILPECEHIHINQWDEFIELLENCD